MTTTTDRPNAYARALVAVAAAEGDLSAFTDELRSVTSAIEGSEELASTLSDTLIPAARRQQIVEDLLGGKATSTTVNLVSMVVANGRVRDLRSIADAVAALGASESGRELAVVRSAVELTDDQRSRLATALQGAVGRPVDVRVEIDPTVLGGLVATIGDTVIDGSVRRRLDQLKQAI